ncbi:putative cysteine desulfurase [archaeon BMS3Bbin15]|nr:putative cysteine desulfurase [archaeon BMS3Bbin15]
MFSKFREDFASLRRKRNGKPPVYLDNGCMTLKPRQVIESINEYFERYPACSGYGRSNHWFSHEVKEATEKAREKVAGFINSLPEEIVWTKNTTEGINLVANAFPFKKGDIVITSDREHNSNLVPWIKLSRVKGIVHKTVPSTQEGIFDLEAFEDMLSPDVKLVSMVHVSNLDGYTLPVEEIIKIAHDYNARVLLDGAQSVPHRKVDIKNLEVDFLAFSVHKMLGPSIGVLYGNYDELKALDTFIVGGDTVSDTSYTKAVFLPPPRKFEAGLQDYAGQIGAGAAVDYLSRVKMERVEAHERRLTELLIEKLSAFPEVKIAGVKNTELAKGIISFRIEDNNRLLVAPSDIAELLDRHYNIMLRAGDLCLHSWFNHIGIGASGVARASFYIYNTREEIEILAEGIEKIIEAEKNGKSITHG